jgi:carotenoid cleavage dioxygenase
VKGTVEHQRLGDFNAEFGRPNETLLGIKHRFGYMAGIHAPGPDTRGFNCLVKYDYQTGACAFQHFSQDVEMTPGEPIFIPHPKAEAEDQGWVLVVCYNPHSNTSELAILDAQCFDAEPVARIRLDHHVPLGFHGNWMPAL